MVTYLIITIIAIGISGGIIWGVFNYLQKQVTSSIEAEKSSLVEKINTVTAELDELKRYTKSYASRGQFDNVVKQVESIKTELEKEKELLKEIEGKLDVAQKTVEEKENIQQELKSAKEEDEKKLEELLTSYEQISSESIALEQKLAQSMKNLDQMMEEVQMTEAQKALVNEISEALTQAGSTLRELIMEYETLNERLNNLRAQHEDLEDEYTKLVEQQLGE
ncbi:MAG: hypothetical protein D6719_03855 [Candidatus Dadabacteria bacterium]|nr:MAG: hypothetical protein D6719_03855 [Candidatus Dadabacteria bacterium]